MSLVLAPDFCATAIIREIAAKGKDARFAKHDRGLFVAGAKA